MKKLLLLLLLVSAGASFAYGDGWDGSLEPCAYGIGVKAGPQFTFWPDREHLIGTFKCQTGSTEQLNGQICERVENEVCDKAPKFNDLYSLVSPYFGIDIHYNMSECVQGFGEFVVRWARGNAKDCPEQPLEFNTKYSGVQKYTLHRETDNFTTFGGYLGMRYFCGCWYECVYPYMGFKAGVLHHKARCEKLELKKDDNVTCASDTFNCGDCKDCTDTDFPCETYFKNTVVSGGLVFGLNWNMWECVDFQFGVEVIGEGCFEGNRNIKIEGCEDDLANISIERVGTGVMVPITFGLTYEF